MFTQQVKFNRRNLGIPKTDTDTTKVSDGSPSTTYELEKTMTVSTNHNEFIAVRTIGGEVAGDKTIVGACDVILGGKVVGYDSQVEFIEDRNYGNAQSISDCSNDSYRAGTRTTNFVCKLGEDVTAEFYLKYAQNLSITSYCTRNNKVTYNLIKVIN